MNLAHGATVLHGGDWAPFLVNAGVALVILALVLIGRTVNQRRSR